MHVALCEIVSATSGGIQLLCRWGEYPNGYQSQTEIFELVIFFWLCDGWMDTLCLKKKNQKGSGRVYLGHLGQKRYLFLGYFNGLFKAFLFTRGFSLFQVEEVKKMKIGDPLDRSTDHGPQNHKAHLDKLVEYCQTGVTEGATLVCGGKQVQRAGTAGPPAATFSPLRPWRWHQSGGGLVVSAGFFFEPAVFTNVRDNMYIAREESFGPVMIVSKFKSG